MKLGRTIVTGVILLVTAISGYGQISYNSGDTGEKILGSYFSTDIDTVSLTNGNLHLNIPLFTLPGRELPVRLALDYNSRFLETRSVPDGLGGTMTVWESFAWRKDTGLGQLTSSRKQLSTNSGFSININGTWYYSSITWNLIVTWVDANGTKNEFTKQVTQYCTSVNPTPCSNPSPTDAVLWDNHDVDSAGSEFYRLHTRTHFSGGGSYASIDFKNGNQIWFGPTELRTTNGNRLTGTATTQTVTNYGTGLGDHLPLADTAGRTIGFSSVGDTQTITLQDANGQTQSYIINFGTIAIEAGNGFSACNVKMVQSIQLPNGRSYTFEYNAQGYVQKVTLPSGGYIRYTYTIPSFIVYTGEYPGRRWVETRAVSSDGTAASEKQWTYTYVTEYHAGAGIYVHDRTVITDPTGAVEEHYYSNPVFQYDAPTYGLEMKVVSKTGWGGTTLQTLENQWQATTNTRLTSRRTIAPNGSSRKTTYQYDSYNNATRQDDYDYSGTVMRTVTRTFLNTADYINAHIFNRIATETTSDQAMAWQTQFEYDNYTAQPLVTRSGTIPGWVSPTSNFRGNATAVKRWLNTASTWIVTSTQYDVLGNAVKTTDPGTHAVQTDFTDRFTDSVSRNSFVYPTRVTEPSGFYVDTTYDFNTGLVRQTTDSLSRTTSTTYDVMNRPLQTTHPNGGWTSYTYDDATPKTTKQVLVDALGNVGRVVSTFDKLYRVTKTETSDPAGNIFVETQYDGKGRKSKTSNPYRAGETVMWTEYTYDGTDRPTITTAPDGSTVQYVYSGNKTTVTDEAANRRRYTYDGLGRMTIVEEPNPTLDSPLVTSYTYNGLGKLTQTAQGYQTRTFIFDTLGRMTHQTLPESGTTTFAYNGDGLMTSKIDARNITTTIAYHTTHVHNVATRSYSDGTPSVSFQYDSAGRQTQMTDALGTVTYSYVTNTDRLQQEQRTLTGITGTFTAVYAYNIKGDLTQMTYPSGRVVNFNYATGGGCCNSRLASVVDSTTSTTVSGSLTYNAAGETLNRTLGNGVTEAFGYNSRLQLASISAVGSSTTLMNVSYDYGNGASNTGRVLARTDAIQPEHDAIYNYDSIYRLKDARGPAGATWAIGWTFDSWGNRLTQTPQGLATSKVGTQTQGYVNNRLTGNTYDNAGNQTNDGLHNYTFNAENQMTQMDSGAAVYGYDGEGRRMKKTVGSETTYYFYGVGGLLCEFTTTSTGATQAASTDRATYRTSDKLGSAVLIMSAAGMVIENNRTLPYGEAWLSEVASTNDKKFTTYQRDQESGLDYALNRFYGNKNGRFNSPDKAGPDISMPLTLNRYSYAIADPINHTDPDGNFISTRRLPPPMPPIGPPVRFQNPFIYLIRERAAQEREQREAARAAQTMQNVNAAYNTALTLLQNPNCAGLFNTSGTGMDPVTLLSNLYTGTTGQFGRITAEPMAERIENGRRVITGATTQPVPMYRLENGLRVLDHMTVTITFNTDPNTLFNRGTDNDRAGVLLHELGHAFNAIPGAGGSRLLPDGPNVRNGTQNSLTNNDTVRRECLN